MQLDRPIRRRDAPPAELARWPRTRLEALGFVEQMRIAGSRRYRASPVATLPTAIASATAALLIGFLDALTDLPEAERRTWSAQLLATLGDDGLVADPADYAEPTQPQPRWALRAHRTRHVLWAVEALGGRLDQPIRWLEPHTQPTAIRTWLDELWASPWPGGFWGAGNWIMDMGVLLDLQHRHLGDAAAGQAVVTLLDALRDRLDPATGFWRGPGDDNRCAMAGAMHLYPLYWAYRQELPYFEQAVLQTLALQQPDGLFAYTVGRGGSQCLDYDAVLVLINGHALLLDHRPAIESACSRVLDAIGVNRLATGAWSDSREPELRYWATRACAYRADGGSLWDTYARLMTVAMCLKVVTGEAPDGVCPERHLFEIWDAGQRWSGGQSPRLAKT